MKSIIVILIGLLVMSGCTKYEFGKNDITETNKYGDLIGHYDPNDWQVYNYSSIPTIFCNQLRASASSTTGDVGIDTNQTSYRIYQGIEQGKFKTDCQLPEFHMIAYPNPAKKGDRVYFSHTCSSNILYSYSLTTRKNGELLTVDASAVGSSYEYLAPGNYLVSSDVDNNDFTLYYLFVTTDSCVFWGKGDVKIQSK